MGLEKVIYSLLAYEKGQAQVCVARLRVAIHPNAVIICPIAMSGEGTTIHIIAYGRIGESPEILSVPDPRNRNNQYNLFQHLSTYVDHYFKQCQKEDSYPQLWVSTGAVAAHLDTIADRLRFSSYDPSVKRLGQLLYYCTERFRIQGQQALHAAAAVLNEHWAVPQDAIENQHLLTVLTSIEPPPGHSLLAAIAEAERVPMASNTNPEFDNVELAPLVRAYNQAQRNRASEAALNYRAQMIEQKLRTVVLPIYEATQRAISLLRCLPLPLLPSLEELEQRETESFKSYIAWLDQEKHIPRRDRPRAAAFGLATREDAVQNFEAALILDDPTERAKGRLRGRVLNGEVIRAYKVRRGRGRMKQEFVLQSMQPFLSIRPGDELVWSEDHRFRVLVITNERLGAVTHITLQITKGMISIGLPANGAVLDFLGNIPEWDRLTRSRQKLKRRLAIAPYTHDSAPFTPDASKPAPTDPLAEVEALR